jgi:hypothetical protein
MINSGTIFLAHPQRNLIIGLVNDWAQPVAKLAHWAFEYTDIQNVLLWTDEPPKHSKCGNSMRMGTAMT